MEFFYFSFGSGQLTNYDLPVKPDKLLLMVPGETEADARSLVFKYIGGDFCTSYDQESAKLSFAKLQPLILELEDLLSYRRELKNGAVVKGLDNNFIRNQFLFNMKTDECSYILTEEDEGYNGAYVYSEYTHSFKELTPNELILWQAIDESLRPKLYTIMPYDTYHQNLQIFMDRIYNG